MPDRFLRIVIATLLLLPAGNGLAKSQRPSAPPTVIDVSFSPNCGMNSAIRPCILLVAAGHNCEATPASRACLIEEAEADARHIENPYSRAQIYALVIEAMLTHGPSSATDRPDQGVANGSPPFLKHAIEAATGASDSHLRIMSMIPLAIVLTKAGHTQGSELFKAVARLVDEEGPGGSPAAMFMGPESAKSEMLSRIARAQAFAGDITGVRETVAMQHTDLWRVKTLAAVVDELVTFGDPALAPEFAGQAATTLASLSDPEAAEQVVAETAGALARVGRGTQALVLAAKPQDPAIRSFAHMNIARALADAGQIADAEEALSRIEISKIRGQALWSIARAKAKAGDFEGAAAVLQDIRMPMARDQAIADVAGFQAAAGDLEGALDRIADLPPEFYRGRGLRVVVEKLIDVGRLAQADEVLTGLGDESLRRVLTVKMAGARARAGETDSALVLARAATDSATRAEALLAIVEAMAVE